MSPDDSPFRLLGQLADLLSHGLRTPLSVVSNDLSFLSTIVGEEECRRAEGRCREISLLLSSLVEFAGIPLEPEPIAIAELMGTDSVSGNLRVDKRRLRASLEVLRNALGADHSIHARDEFLVFSYPTGGVASHNLTDLVSRSSRRNALLAPLVEAFFLASGARITLHDMVELSFPIVER